LAFEVVASAPLIERALEEEEAARPTVALPFRQLLQISVYWLGINAIMGGIGIAVQERIPDLVPLGEKGTYIAIQGFAILWVNILVQPTIGMISDYTVSRWGRRKPYIAIGATRDVQHLHLARRLPFPPAVQLELRPGAVPGICA
jgi:hypothetical protein